MTRHPSPERKGMPFILRRLPRPASASRPPSSPAMFHDFPVRENACRPRDMKWSARPSRRPARESGLSMRRHLRRPLRPPAGVGEGVGSSLSCVSCVSRESRPVFSTLPFLPDNSVFVCFVCFVEEKGFLNSCNLSSWINGTVVCDSLVPDVPLIPPKAS